MTNKSKQKGTTWESAIVAYLNENGYPHAERRALSGAIDKGDIAGLPGVVIEAKATKALSVGAQMKETETERVNASADVGVLIWKRPQQNVKDAAAIVPLWQFVELLKRAGY